MFDSATWANDFIFNNQVGNFVFIVFVCGLEGDKFAFVCVQFQLMLFKKSQILLMFCSSNSTADSIFCLM